MVDRIDQIIVTIIGIKDTPYENAKIEFELTFPSNYPHNPPICFCRTPIWHHYIDLTIPRGKTNICLALIDPECIGKRDPEMGFSGWLADNTLTDVIKALKAIIHLQAPYYDPMDSINFRNIKHFF